MKNFGLVRISNATSLPPSSDPRLSRRPSMDPSGGGARVRPARTGCQVPRVGRAGTGLLPGASLGGEDAPNFPSSCFKTASLSQFKSHLFLPPTPCTLYPQARADHLAAEGINFYANERAMHSSSTASSSSESAHACAAMENMMVLRDGVDRSVSHIIEVDRNYQR